MATVKEIWGMCCPKCKQDDRIMVQVHMMVQLMPTGTDLDDGDHEWDSESVAECQACGYRSRVWEFTQAAEEG